MTGSKFTTVSMKLLRWNQFGLHEEKLVECLSKCTWSLSVLEHV